MDPSITLIASGGAIGALSGPVLVAVARRHVRGTAVPGHAAAWVATLVSALLGAALVVRATTETALLPGLVVFAAVGVVACTVDIAEYRLPDAVILPGAIAVVALLAGGAFIAAEPMVAVGAVVGAVGLAQTYLVLAIVSRGRLGMGDVKFGLLAGAVTGAFGVHTWLTGLLVGVLVNGAVALVALVAHRGGGRVPFGPSIFIGAVIAVLLA